MGQATEWKRTLLEFCYICNISEVTQLIFPRQPMSHWAEIFSYFECDEKQNDHGWIATVSVLNYRRKHNFIKANLIC